MNRRVNKSIYEEKIEKTIDLFQSSIFVRRRWLSHFLLEQNNVSVLHFSVSRFGNKLLDNSRTNLLWHIKFIQFLAGSTCGLQVRSIRWRPLLPGTQKYNTCMYIKKILSLLLFLNFVYRYKVPELAIQCLIQSSIYSQTWIIHPHCFPDNFGRIRKQPD